MITGIIAGGRLSTGGGNGYGFRPSDIANLKFWWRMDSASNTVTFDSTNTVFSTFADQSGNGITGSWAGGRALVKPAEVGNLQAADFFGGSRYDLPSGSFSGVTAAQMFVALKCANDPPITAKTGFMFFGTDTTNLDCYPWTDSKFYSSFGHTTQYIAVNPTASITTWHRFCQSAQATGWVYYVNNASEGAGATNVGSAWRTVPRFGNGTNDGAVTLSLDAKVLDVICYSRVLNSTERGQVDTYLADRISGVWAAS